jgi:hypothetical protein
MSLTHSELFIPNFPWQKYNCDYLRYVALPLTEKNTTHHTNRRYWRYMVLPHSALPLESTT